MTTNKEQLQISLRATEQLMQNKNISIEDLVCQSIFNQTAIMKSLIQILEESEIAVDETGRLK